MNRTVLFLAALAVTAMSPPASAAPGSKAEYWNRLSAVPPRSAEAFADLGEWCRGQGLEAEALQCLERALEIDSDCERARTALGYRRHGAGWRKDGEPASGYPRSKPSSASLRLPPVKPPAVTGAAPPAAEPALPAAGPAPAQPGQPPPPEPEAAPAAPAAVPEAPPAQPAPPEAQPEAVKVAPPPARGGTSSGATAKPQVEAFTEAIEAKKAWAKSAGERIAASFFTFEDADFLVHSTLPASSREMKLLLGNLRSARKAVAAVIGAGAGTRIWPAKLQLFLLKSEPELERFATMVDRMPSGKSPEGLYTVPGAHTVVLNPESSALWRVVGETSLDFLNGSDRWVPWWLTDGIGQLLLAQSPEGQKGQHYPRTLRYAADVIKAEGDALKIFNLLETPEYKDKDQTKNLALALSLVDFLFNKVSRGGFQNLIKAIKSDAAPAPPATDSKSKEEFNAFHLSFIAFQEATLESCFRTKVPTLGERWKLYALQVAEQLKAEDAAKEKEDAQKAQKKGQGKGKGKGG
ncbi:MAG: hypothetical protein HY721_32255 [Planctomycetes bacterium]|nr:hypothetical protein [Planctomycetota bacterium]